MIPGSVPAVLEMAKITPACRGAISRWLLAKPANEKDDKPIAMVRKTTAVVASFTDARAINELTAFVLSQSVKANMVAI